LHVESVFTRRFGNRFSVKQITTTLREFLKDVADVDSTVRIRKKRSELVDHIRDELFQYAAEIHELKPGWSLLQECRLNAAEKYWLDPGRSAQDEGFAAQYQRGDWQNEICLRFGNWLNAAIGTKDTPMGQAEASAWQSVIAAELAKIRLELSDHD
jgi:CRISPR-associated protein Csy1